ncbi:MAG: response regulator [Reichenbachiella sp.]
MTFRLLICLLIAIQFPSQGILAINKDIKKEYFSLFIRYYAQSKSQKLEKARETLDSLEILAINLGPEQELEVYYEIIDIEYDLGNYFSTINYANRFKKLAPDYSVETKNIAVVYAYLGISYYHLGEFSLALDALFSAVQKYENIGDTEGMANCNSNIASVYEQLTNYQQAIRYINLNLVFYKGVDGLEGYVVNSYIQLARNFENINELDISKSYVDSALLIAEIEDLQDALPSIYRTYGYVYRKSGDLNQALEYFRKSYKKAIEEKDFFTQGQVIYSIVKLHYDEKDYLNAIRISEEYLSNTNSNAFQSNLLNIKEKLYHSYVFTDQYKKAVNIQEKYRPLADSLSSLSKYNKIKQAEMRALVDQQETENELLKKLDEINKQTIKVQNLFLVTAAIILFLVIVIALTIHRAAKINKNLSEKNKFQADRLLQLDEAKSRFFANISHDLRTPLTLIMGGIHQVMDSKDNYLTTKSEKHLRTSIKNGERIIHLTNEINELIKLEDNKLKIERKYIDIDEMLKLFTQMFNSLTSIKGVQLSYSRSIFEVNPIVFIDPFQFEKVLFNLLTNAIKHTKEGDSITVSLNTDSNNKSILISIIDSGEGISEQKLPYIFDRYYQAPDTTHKTQVGFGIGLALVKEIINKHKASIEVRSSQGKGSEFIIMLPIAHNKEKLVVEYGELNYSEEKRDLFKDIDDPERQVPVVNINSPAPEDSLGQSRSTILIVEDHPEIRDYIKDILDEKYDILLASNGKRALQVLEKEKIDLLVTDLMMPWFDGFELLEELKSNDKYQNIPALVLSARTSEEDKEKVLSFGVNDFLTKPFNPKELIQRVENLINQNKTWNNNNADALFINSQNTLDEIEKSLLKKVDSIILCRIGDPNLSVGQLAVEIAMSERKFYRMIKKLTDGTPFEYIKEVRLQFALDLIKSKNINNASEVAKFIGMNNVSNFNSQFKKRFGKLPADMMQ